MTPITATARIAMVLAAVGAVVGCGGPAGHSPPPQSTPVATSRGAASSSHDPVSHDPHIAATSWTDGPWPFTVAEGDLGCAAQNQMQVQTFTAGGVTYALNVAAKVTGRYRAIDVIWRANPQVPGTKVDIAEVVDYARALCAG